MSTRLQTQVEGSWAPYFTCVPTGLLQRKCACGQHTIAGGECEECRTKRVEASLAGTPSLQRHAAEAREPATVPPIVYEVLRSPGQPLDPATRAFFEPRFGHDFSQVRVHTDARAAESARAVNALAYTVGRDVVFAAGQYSPGTSAVRRLLAHELTHVVQQTGGLPGTLAVNPPGEEYEQEADRTALFLSEELPISSVRHVGTGLMHLGEEHQAGEQKAGPSKEEDPDVRELKDKVGKLVKANFGGDYKKAFDHYDANHDGGVDSGEIRKLLEDAGVGNAFTRGRWVAGILARMDTNKNGKVEWKEFEDGIKG